MRYLRSLLAFSIWVLASCDRSAAPTALDGYWVHVRAAEEPPGFGLGIVFTTSDGEISGSGTWQGEAGPSGTLTAIGGIEHGTVTLDLTFTQVLNGVPQQGSFVEHFVGTFTSYDDLEGTTTQNGQTGMLHLHRSAGP
jgi:hypothetical protein